MLCYNISIKCLTNLDKYRTVIAQRPWVLSIVLQSFAGNGSIFEWVTNSGEERKATNHFTTSLMAKNLANEVVFVLPFKRLEGTIAIKLKKTNSEKSTMIVSRNDIVLLQNVIVRWLLSYLLSISSLQRSYLMKIRFLMHYNRERGFQTWIRFSVLNSCK